MAHTQLIGVMHKEDWGKPTWGAAAHHPTIQRGTIPLRSSHLEYNGGGFAGSSHGL